MSKTMKRNVVIAEPGLAILSSHWRALNFFNEALGAVPIGQHFVYVTLMNLHGRGWYPTVGELAAITGLARPSVSRHVSALTTCGLVGAHAADGDRRCRLHRLTRRGESQRSMLIRMLGRPARDMATSEGSSRSMAVRTDGKPRPRSTGGRAVAGRRATTGVARPRGSPASPAGRNGMR